jgi:hypothetical protein
MDPIVLGHTFFRASGCSSRIDLALVYPQSFSTGASCAVDNSFDFGLSTDHRPLLFSVPLLALALAPEVQRWTPDRVNISNLNSTARRDLTFAINDSVGRSSAHWMSALDQMSLGTPGAEDVLEAAAKCLTSSIWDPSFAKAGSSGPIKPRSRHPSVRLVAARANLKNLITLHDILQSSLKSSPLQLLSTRRKLPQLSRPLKPVTVALASVR